MRPIGHCFLGSRVLCCDERTAPIASFSEFLPPERPEPPSREFPETSPGGDNE